jgi:DNA-binding transcriptional ArsR family regulator
MVKQSDDTLDLTFSALADPTRRRILESLSHREWRVTDLAEPFSMSLPAVSKHLCVLENAGLLKRRRLGREHYLKLEAAPMRRAASWIEHYRKFWEGSLDHLAKYLESNSVPEIKPVKKNKKGKKP